MKKIEEQTAYAGFQASCSFSTPAFDRESQTCHRSHSQNPIQEDLWIAGTSLLLLQRTTKKPVTCKLVTSDLVFPTVTITNGAAQGEPG